MICTLLYLMSIMTVFDVYITTVYIITMATGSCLVWVRPCDGFLFTMMVNLKRVKYKTL